MEDGHEFVAVVLGVDAVEGFAMVGLLRSQSGEPGGCAKFVEGALHGFDFADLVVAVEGFYGAVFPEFAVEGFHAGGAEGGLVDFEVER